jgi:hypothetical protein
MALHKRQISLRAFILVCGVVGAIGGIAVSYYRHLMETNALIARIEGDGGNVVCSWNFQRFLVVPMKEIQEADLSGPKEPLDSRTLAALSEQFYVRSLKLDNRILSNQQMQFIWGMNSIERLDLCNTNIADTDFDGILRLARLRSLNIAECSTLTDICVNDLELLPSLENLCVSRTEVTIDRLAQLRLQRLHTLDACYCTGRSIDLTPRGFGGMHLKALIVRGSRVNTITVDVQHPNEWLRSLDLRGTPTCWKGLARGVVNLAELAIDSNTLDETLLDELPKMRALSKLIVSDDVGALSFAPVETIAMNGVNISVPSGVKEKASRVFNEVIQSPHVLEVSAEGQVRGAMYSSRRVYGHHE